MTDMHWRVRGGSGGVAHMAADQRRRAQPAKALSSAPGAGCAPTRTARSIRGHCGNGHIAMRMTLAIVTLCLSVVQADAQSPPPVRPNVVLIVTDDVGYGDIGSYGARDVKTPSIDSLARDGVRLTDFYAAPQCTPTRAALISGRYQQRVRLEAALSGPKTPAGATGLPATGYSLP